MLYLIAYDLSNNRRRTKLHKTLCGFGKWTQFSMFECFLNDTEFIALRARINQIIDTSEDNVRIYHICTTCQAKTITLGSKKPHEDKLYLL